MVVVVVVVVVVIVDVVVIVVVVVVVVVAGVVVVVVVVSTSVSDVPVAPRARSTLPACGETADGASAPKRSAESWRSQKMIFRGS